MEAAIVFLTVMVGFLFLAFALYVAEKAITHFENRHIPKDKNYQIPPQQNPTLGTQIKRPGSDPDHSGSFKGF